MAKMNLAEAAEAYRVGKHDSWEDPMWEGIRHSIDILVQKMFKIGVNGGCLRKLGTRTWTIKIE